MSFETIALSDLGGLSFCLAITGAMLLFLLSGWHKSLQQHDRSKTSHAEDPLPAQGYVELIGRQFAPPGSCRAGATDGYAVHVVALPD
ncbi:hypothetical protein [Rhodanobacter lindaniclasticus]